MIPAWVRKIALGLLFVSLGASLAFPQAKVKYNLRGLIQNFCKADFGSQDVAVFAEIKLSGKQSAVIFWPMPEVEDKYQEPLCGAIFEKLGKSVRAIFAKL